MTKLEAINLALRAVGLSRITTTAGIATNGDASRAWQTIQEESRQVQLQGWEFNTVREKTLAPQAVGTPDAGKIVLGADVLKVDAINPSIRVSRRGKVLFDLDKDTPVFAGPVIATLVRLLEWDDLEEWAQAYIAIRGARVFASERGGTLGSDLSAEREALARVAFEQADADLADETFATANPHVRRQRRR